MERQCRNCEYAIKGEKDPNNVAAPALIHCRRNPPALLPVAMRGGTFSALSLFPQVGADAWCGEYKPWHTERADRPPPAPVVPTVKGQN